MIEQARSARRALLSGLIDDASLFPPAQLPLPQSIAEHFEHRASPFDWMVGRYVCPASGLADLARFVPPGGAFATSVVLDGVEPPTSTDAIEIQCAEMRAPTGASSREVAAVLRALSEAIVPSAETIYVEIAPAAPESARSLAAVAAARGGTDVALAAKIRCGGVTPDTVPAVSDVARFIRTCADLGLPFKATAGLHHPIRGRAADVGFVMHGFLNVAAAALFAHVCNLDVARLSEILASECSDEFVLDDDVFSWRDLVLSSEEVLLGRRFFHSYGSCSFDDPVIGLGQLGML